MNTGITLNRAVKIPMGRYTSIIAPKGISVEVTDWRIDSKDCQQVKITLWLGGFQIAYEGPLSVSLMDIDWDTVEIGLREE